MTKTGLGNHTKTIASPAEAARIRSFYKDVLGCEVTSSPTGMNVVAFGNGAFMGIAYEANALSGADLLRGTWLELKTEEPAELEKKVVAFGVKRIDYSDQAHFYFQAPGGQVYRIAPANE